MAIVVGTGERPHNATLKTNDNYKALYLQPKGEGSSTLCTTLQRSHFIPRLRRERPIRGGRAVSSPVTDIASLT